MKLIDEILKYCSHNGLVSNDDVFQIMRLGLTSYCPQCGCSPCECSKHDAIELMKNVERDAAANQDLESENDSILRSRHSGKKSIAKSRMTAPILNEHLGPTLAELVENVHVQSVLRAMRSLLNNNEVGKEPLNLTVFAEMLQNIRNLDEEKFQASFIQILEAPGKKRILLNDLYRILLLIPDCSFIEDRSGPAIQAFCLIVDEQYTLVHIKKYSWLLKWENIRIFFLYREFQRRLFCFMLKTVENDFSRFSKWSDNFGRLRFYDWKESRSTQLLSLWVHYFLTYDNSDEKNTADIKREQSSSLLQLLKYCNEQFDALSLALRFNPTLTISDERGNVIELGELSEGRCVIKKTLTIKGIDYTFCLCPAGEFMMGSPESEEDRYDDETQHRVKLTKDFWLLETPVTQEMWESVMGTTIEEQRDEADKEWELAGVGSRYPMYYVCWSECQEFINKLNKENSELEMRLPSEAEWEYACRAGSTGAYGGTGDLDVMGWYYANSGIKTHEVKTKRANTWGLYDMHGNVWEWCQDWYDYDYYKKSPPTDPTGPESGLSRVNRGGSWCYFARDCRSADRSGFDPGFRGRYLGFRLAASSAR